MFNVEITTESFCCMLHIVTCWLAEGDAVNDQVSETELEELIALHGSAAQHVQREDGQHLTFVYDADPDKAFYEPDFRPRMRVKGLAEGHASVDGEGAENYFYRTLCDGRTLVTWEVSMSSALARQAASSRPAGKVPRYSVRFPPHEKVVNGQVEKICKVGASFDLRQYPVDVQGLDIGLEMKTGVAETILVPFPDEATFAHTPSGQVADVMKENVFLEDYSLLKNHEYSASLYKTKASQSWQGVEYAGVRVTVWLRRKFMHDLINIAAAQCVTTSFVYAVWAIPKEKVAERISCDFALVLAVSLYPCFKRPFLAKVALVLPGGCNEVRR